MADFDQETIANDDIADLNDFNEVLDFHQALFLDENGVTYFFYYLIEFYGPLIFNDGEQEEEKDLMSDEELESFMTEDDNFRQCFNYNEMCVREE